MHKQGEGFKDCVRRREYFKLTLDTGISQCGVDLGFASAATPRLRVDGPSIAALHISKRARKRSPSHQHSSLRPLKHGAVACRTHSARHTCVAMWRFLSPRSSSFKGPMMCYSLSWTFDSKCSGLKSVLGEQRKRPRVSR